jgi:hypothetical protein
VNATEKLADAQAALEHGAHPVACDLAWRAAAAAARVGNESVLAQVVELAGALVAARLDGAEQLRVYASAALEDARRGTRPPSAFERLISRDRRPH